MAWLAEYSSQELLQAQLQLWHQSLGFFKSVALAVAMDLRIADAIHRLGGAATLPQILTEAGINPCKLRDLRRIMLVLTVSGIFTVHQPASTPAVSESDDGVRRDRDEEAPVYKLTAASRLLVVGEKSLTTTRSQQQQLLPSLVVQVQLNLETCRGSALSKAMLAWFRQDQDQQPPAGLSSPFALACGGQTIWERAERNAEVFPFDEAMVSDTAFLMPIVLKECGEVFHGLTSLVDVAGGLGGAAATIAAAFPGLKCTVLDLPQVVAKAPPSAGTNVQYVAGDMFQSIPPADAVFLKVYLKYGNSNIPAMQNELDMWILHDWNDDECAKILKNCKQAIPPRDAGGKVIIIDMVVGSEPTSDMKHLETQVLFDLLIMSINGVERDEQEWKKVFLEAGFADYRIIPVLGVRSLIELYP